LMSESPVNREGSRHVDVKYHFLRECVHLGEIKLSSVWVLATSLMLSPRVCPARPSLNIASICGASASPSPLFSHAVRPCPLPTLVLCLSPDTLSLLCVY
jgi:hypothetical protein